MDLPTFRTNRPEFNAAADARVLAAIAQATLRTDSSVWGDLAETAIELLTAHILSVGPSGREARFRPTGDSTYSLELDRLRLERCGGYGITP